VVERRRNRSIRSLPRYFIGSWCIRRRGRGSIS